MAKWLLAGAIAWMALAPSPAYAGMINPDISVIGQPSMTLTDDPEDPDRERPRLDAGETEIVFDAYLNPYSKGFFTLAIGDEGLELEEGYFTVLRGLPFGMNLKGGKYRAGFGRLNPAHPHTYPFPERFRLLQNYLPGEESMNDVGISLSERFALPGEASLIASVDWLQGEVFRVARETGNAEEDPILAGEGDGEDLTRPGMLGRLAFFDMLGETSGIEIGASVATGVNNVAAGSRTTLLGIDIKSKLWTSPRSYLLLQAEGIRTSLEEAAWDPVDGYSSETVDGIGGYLFADYGFSRRHNAGVSYERYQRPEEGSPWDQAIGLFAGYAVLEESLVLRAAYDRFIPDGSDAVNTVMLRVIYSMGPHKAHQF